VVAEFVDEGTTIPDRDNDGPHRERVRFADACRDDGVVSAEQGVGAVGGMNSALDDEESNDSGYLRLDRESLKKLPQQQER
jgi:hypothetical protein